MLDLYGKNEWILTSNSRDEANKCISNQFFAELGLKAFVPPYALSRKGKIFDVPLDITIDELEEAIREDNKGIDVMHIRRLPKRVITNGRVEWQDGESVCVEFRGKSLPEAIIIWRTRLRVTPYIESVTVCYNCGKLRHPKKYCSSEKLCPKCGDPYHTDEGQRCEGDARCINCKGKHSTLDKSCPTLCKERDINRIMACDNLPYLLAKRTKEGFIQQPKAPAKTVGNFPPLSRGKDVQAINYHAPQFIRNSQPDYDKENFSNQAST